jgi:hypothetical protein
MLLLICGVFASPHGVTMLVRNSGFASFPRDALAYARTMNVAAGLLLVGIGSLLNAFAR